MEVELASERLLDILKHHANRESRTFRKGCENFRSRNSIKGSISNEDVLFSRVFDLFHESFIFVVELSGSDHLIRKTKNINLFEELNRSTCSFGLLFFLSFNSFTRLNVSICLFHRLYWDRSSSGI